MIKVYNTMTLIENCDEESTYRIERALSIYDPVAHKVTLEAFRKFTRKGIAMMVIPRSYPLKWLTEIFPNKEVVYYDRDNSCDVEVDNIEAIYSPRDSKQRKVMKWLDEQYRFPQKLISLKPGDGKTYIALKYICDEKKKALIVVHSLDVMKQWKERIAQLTTIKPERVAVISGRENFNKVLDSHENYDIFIAIHKTLHMLIQESPKILENFRRVTQIGIKVVDEAHLMMASLISIDLNSNFTDNLYLTATPERVDYQENRVYRLVLPVYFAFDLGNDPDKLQENEKVHTCYFIGISLGCTQADTVSMVTRRGFNLPKWGEWVLQHGSVGIFVEKFVRYYEKATEKLKKLGIVTDKPIAVVLMSRLEHCKEFETILTRRFGVPKEDIGQFNGLRTKAKKFDELKKRIIISTEKSLGQAIDIRIDCVFDFVPYSSKTLAWQIVGRLRKEFGCLYYNFYDVTNYKCVDSNKSKIRVLKPRVANIIEMNSIK